MTQCICICHFGATGAVIHSRSLCNVDLSEVGVEVQPGVVRKLRSSKKPWPVPCLRPTENTVEPPPQQSISAKNNENQMKTSSVVAEWLQNQARTMPDQRSFCHKSHKRGGMCDQVAAGDRARLYDLPDELGGPCASRGAFRVWRACLKRWTLSLCTWLG
jgi:hypothetical protein